MYFLHSLLLMWGGKVRWRSRTADVPLLVLAMLPDMSITSSDLPERQQLWDRRSQPHDCSTDTTVTPCRAVDGGQRRRHWKPCIHNLKAFELSSPTPLQSTAPNGDGEGIEPFRPQPRLVEIGLSMRVPLDKVRTPKGDLTTSKNLVFYTCDRGVCGNHNEHA